MKPDALPEMSMGDDKAPVTVIEYASMTCSHCAHFQETTFPELKKRYIDTGKVRYIFREFPLDNLAGGRLHARAMRRQGRQGQIFCPDRHVVPPAAAMGGRKADTATACHCQTGRVHQSRSFNACLANQQVLDGIESIRQRAVDKFKVQSTPTFFINGTSYPGALSIDDMAKVIDPYLKG